MPLTVNGLPFREFARMQGVPVDGSHVVPQPLRDAARRFYLERREEIQRRLQVAMRLRATRQHMVMAFLVGGPQTSRQVADQAGIPIGNASTALLNLWVAGRIDRQRQPGIRGRQFVYALRASVPAEPSTQGDEAAVMA